MYYMSHCPETVSTLSVSDLFSTVTMWSIEGTVSSHTKAHLKEKYTE